MRRSVLQPQRDACSGRVVASLAGTSLPDFNSHAAGTCQAVCPLRPGFSFYAFSVQTRTPGWAGTVAGQGQSRRGRSPAWDYPAMKVYHSALFCSIPDNCLGENAISTHPSECVGTGEDAHLGGDDGFTTECAPSDCRKRGISGRRAPGWLVSRWAVLQIIVGRGHAARQGASVSKVVPQR